MLLIARRVLAAALLGLALPGCSSDRDQTDSPPHRGAERSTSTAAAERDPGEFPARPDLIEDFSAGAPAWPAGELADGSATRPNNGTYLLRVAGGRDLHTAAAPIELRDENRGTLIETSVRPAPGGRVGLFCRGSADGGTGYFFLLGDDGSWSVSRRRAGEERVLRSGVLPELDRPDNGELVLLRLACGTGVAGGILSMGVTINASGLFGVNDPDGLPAPPSSRVGLAVAREPGAAAFEADFDHVGVTLAVP